MEAMKSTGSPLEMQVNVSKSPSNKKKPVIASFSTLEKLVKKVMLLIVLWENFMMAIRFLDTKTTKEETSGFWSTKI
jgi:hypothetical protein